MLKLTAVYKQGFNSMWEGYIEELPHIVVLNAEDLETAKVLLRILTAEEVEDFTLTRNNRKKWDIVQEQIYKFTYFEKDDNHV